MVKLTRILKSEYRDDVLSKRSNRRSNKKKQARDAPTETDPPARESEPTSPGREEVKLPPALLKILQSHTPSSHHSDREDREQAEPLSPTSQDNPHHFALTRAAQMALSSMPVSADGDDRSTDASTMAMIDAIVKTSDDPALIEAIQKMMGDASSQSHQQRETLALVAESIMEKRAAKEALERAVMAESRLHESLKKCAPEIGSDAASAVMEAYANADGPTPVAANGSNTGFFQRINKSLTESSNSSKQRRFPFVKTRAKGHKKSSKDKDKSKDKGSTKAEKTGKAEAPIELDSTGAEYVEHTSDEPVFLMSTQPFSPTKEESEEEVNEEEARDDQEDSRTEHDDSDSKPPTEDLASPSSVRKNKYKHITSIEPDIASRFGSRRSSRVSSSRGRSSSRRHDDSTLGSTLGQSTIEAMGEWSAGQWSAYIGHGTTATSKSNCSGSGVSTSVDDEDTLEDGSDSDSGTNENTDDENLRLEFTAEGEDEPKIEYTIFELESKLSMSTADDMSSVGSLSSAGDTHTEDHEDEDDIGTDIETLDTGTTRTDAGTEDEITFVEGVETAPSGDTGEEEVDDEASDSSDDEDEDNTLLFASFCQRPEEASDDEDSHDRRSRRREERKQERKERKERRHKREESGSLLKCVSGYFGGGDGDADVEVYLDDKKKGRRRRRRHRDHD